MTHPQFTRRRLLSVSGSVAIAGLAGCTAPSAPTGADGGADTDPTDGHHDGDPTEHGHDETTEDHHDGESTEHGHDETTEDHHDGESTEHGHDHDEGAPDGPSASAEVVMASSGGGQHYKPHVVWVEPGGSVTWRLESGAHDAVAYHPDNDKPARVPDDAEPWRTDLLTEQGATATHTFETEGVYDYCCTPHESVGMVGTVIVGHPDPHDQPALAEPESSLPEAARAELGDLGDIVTEALEHGD